MGPLAFLGISLKWTVECDASAEISAVSVPRLVENSYRYGIMTAAISADYRHINCHRLSSGATLPRGWGVTASGPWGRAFSAKELTT